MNNYAKRPLVRCLSCGKIMKVVQVEEDVEAQYEFWQLACQHCGDQTAVVQRWTLPYREDERPPLEIVP